MTDERVELTKSVTTDKLIEGGTGRIFLIDRTRYTDADGVVVSESVHRRPIEPDQDVADEARDVQELAELTRTQRERADAEREQLPPEPRET